MLTKQPNVNETEWSNRASSQLFMPFTFSPEAVNLNLSAMHGYSWRMNQEPKHIPHKIVGQATYVTILKHKQNMALHFNIVLLSFTCNIKKGQITDSTAAHLTSAAVSTLCPISCDACCFFLIGSPKKKKKTHSIQCFIIYGGWENNTDQCAYLWAPPFQEVQQDRKHHWSFR